MSSSNIQWHLTERGDRGKPGILFLHGFMGRSGIWSPTIDHLWNDYHCVAVDLPGHGQTTADLSNLSFDATAEAIVKLCSEKFSHPPVICGYSMGGRIALQTALNFPGSFSALVLESANPGIENEHERRKRLLTDNDWAFKLSLSSMPEFLIEWYAQPVFSYLADDIIERIIEKKSTGNPKKLSQAMLIYSQGLQQPLWQKLPGWEQPALIVAGERDQKYCEMAERMAALLPESELCKVPEAGHIVHLEQRNRFISALKSWLDKRII